MHTQGHAAKGASRGLANRVHIYCFLSVFISLLCAFAHGITRPAEQVVHVKHGVCLFRSADHPSVPEKAGIVRAETIISGISFSSYPYKR